MLDFNFVFSHNMKVSIALTIVFFSAVAIGATLYGEKDDIVAEVTRKYDQAIAFSDKVAQEIAEEKGKNEDSAANEAKKSGINNSEVVGQKFEKDIVDTARSAIARGKPIAAIECIIRVANEGRKLIKDTLTQYTEAVDAVKPNREKELDVEKQHTDIIKTATTGLRGESLGKLEKENNINNLRTLKNDGIKKANTAYKQLQDIEARILRPVLKERYKNLRNANDVKYTEIKDTLLKRLQKCIG